MPIMRAPPQPTDCLIRSTIFNDDRSCRFELRVIWDVSKPLLGWLLANPSWANETRPDMTFQRVWKFTERDGVYGGFVIGNVVPVVDADAAAARQRVDHAYLNNEGGPTVDMLAIQHNAVHLRKLASEIPEWCLAYGDVGRSFGEHAKWAVDDLLAGGARFMVLDVTGSGTPKHPMARALHRIPDDRPFHEFDVEAWSMGGPIAALTPPSGGRSLF